jgi:glycosyltransferase involved in cell wall biosynthesis
MRRLRLAYLVTHPIQYQAPLLRLVAAQPDIDFTAFFGTDFSARAFTAGEFGQKITWDVPLLDGYRYEILPQLFSPPEGQQPPLDLWRPINYDLARRLKGFDALWVHGYARAFHWAAIAAARRRGLKVLLRDEATAISAERSPLKATAKRLFFAALGRGVDAFLPIGTLNRRYYEQNGIAPSRLFDVPYAVDNAHFRSGAEKAAQERDATRASLGLEPERPILLFAAKLIERKRPGVLLEAFARLHQDPALRRPYLVFVGDGPLRPQLEAEAQARAPGAVRFLGFQPQRDLPRWYDLCDAFVLPSAQEAWGLVVNEVMCAGKAVIASTMIGAAPDLVKPGDNGAIFRVDDTDDLVRAMRDVLADPDRLASMGRRSLALIERWSFAEDIAGLRAALAATCPGFATEPGATEPGR